MSAPHASVQEEEPRSPGWLPALGVALFAAAAVAWSLCSAPSTAPASPSGSAAPPPSGAPPH
jgi:hypothetical protein